MYPIYGDIRLWFEADYNTRSKYFIIHSIKHERDQGSLASQQVDTCQKDALEGDEGNVASTCVS